MKRLLLIAAFLIALCVPASAQFNGCSAGFCAPKATALPGPPVLTFVSSSQGGSHSGAVETYTSQNIGTASGFTTRRIICVVAYNNVNGTAISSATIGGVTATVHVNVSSGATDPFIGIFSADIPTGTTATIAVTYNNNIFNDQPLAVYSVDDALLVSTTPQSGSASTLTSVTTLSTSSFTQTTGGFTVAGAASGTAPGTFAITGYTTDLTASNATSIVTHLSSIGSTGSVTATATQANAGGLAVAAASWR